MKDNTEKPVEKKDTENGFVIINGKKFRKIKKAKHLPIHPTDDRFYEIKNAKKYDNGVRIKWFSNQYFDLIVWFDDNDNIISFQLTYDKFQNPYAITWRHSRGFLHEKVDDGETGVRRKKTPILLPDGFFPHQEIAEKFKIESTDIDSVIKNFVFDKISNFGEKGDGDNYTKPISVFFDMEFSLSEKRRLLFYLEHILKSRGNEKLVRSINNIELFKRIEQASNNVRMSFEKFEILFDSILLINDGGLLNREEDLFIITRIPRILENYIKIIDTVGNTEMRKVRKYQDKFRSLGEELSIAKKTDIPEQRYTTHSMNEKFKKVMALAKMMKK